MKRTTTILAIGCVLCLIFGTVALAAESSSQGASMGRGQGQPAQMQRSGQHPTQQMGQSGQPGKSAKMSQQQQAKVAPAKASDIMDKTVKNDKGEDLGTISDLVISRDGSVVFALLSHGGFLGIGNRLIPIPWHALQPGKKRGVVIISMSKDQLNKAPNVSERELSNLNRPDWKQKLEQYYSQATSAASQGQGTGQASMEKGKARRPGEWEKEATQPKGGMKPQSQQGKSGAGSEQTK